MINMNNTNNGTTINNVPSITMPNFPQIMFTPDRLQQMGVINAEAFCEICCKEFCNKYFLRTHKMNKHRIPDCQAPFSNNPNNANKFNNPANSGNNFQQMNSNANFLPQQMLAAAAATNFPLLFPNSNLNTEEEPGLLKMHKYFTNDMPFIKQEQPESDSPVKKETVDVEMKNEEDDDKNKTMIKVSFSN